MSLVATIVMVIMANLMCWSCVRKRYQADRDVGLVAPAFIILLQLFML